MTEKSENPRDALTVQRQCAGGCGARLSYALATGSQPYAPELYCLDGASCFRAGHLCADCEIVVMAALDARHAQLQLERLPAAVRDLAARRARRADHRAARTRADGSPMAAAMSLLPLEQAIAELLHQGHFVTLGQLCALLEAERIAYVRRTDLHSKPIDPQQVRRALARLYHENLIVIVDEQNEPRRYRARG